jgi:hypothetical protein
VSTLRHSNERDGLREARLCFDHLAGRVGVALTEGLVANGLLVASPGGYLVSADGRAAFAGLDIDVDALLDQPRPLTRACLDRSEGRDHLAGSLGGALANTFVQRGWLQTREATRVVRLTPTGRDAIDSALGVDLGAPHASHRFTRTDPPVALAATAPH